MDEEAQFQPPLSKPAPGQLLAEGREARGWSVGEVAMRLKFSARQIEALEAEAYHALPEPTIVRGMVRNYARALGIDAQPLLADLEQRLNHDPMTLMAPGMYVPFTERKKSSARMVLGLTIVALLAIGVFAAQWWYEKQRAAGPVAAVAKAPSRTSASAPAPVRPPVVVEAPSEAVPPSQEAETIAGNKRVEFSFADEAWVEVTDSSGRILLAQLNAPNSRAAVEGKPPFQVVVGNASAVHMVYEGNAVDMRASTRNDVARLTLD